MSPENFKKSDEKDDKNQLSKYTMNEMTSKEFYLDKNARFHLHETLIRDFTRTEAFKTAFDANKHLLKDKYVMEVASGAALLSLFVCKAGAKKVFAVEDSKINQIAEEVVKLNDLQNVIHLINSRVEDIISLPLGIPKVDVLVCDWIGYCLFHDSCLPSLIHARDHFLSPGGHILPDLACMYITVLEDFKHVINHEHWWGDVYGFDMSCMMEASLTEPRVECVDPKSIVAESYLLMEVDANVVTMSQVHNTSHPFLITTTKPATIHALVLYFDVTFSKCHTYVGFSTSPGAPYTHYQQTTLYLATPISADEGEKIRGDVTFKENQKKKNGLLIDLDIDFQGRQCSIKQTMHYIITF